jgi:hypothetical protein
MGSPQRIDPEIGLLSGYVQVVHQVSGLTAKKSSTVAQADMVTLIDAPEETVP